MATPVVKCIVLKADGTAAEKDVTLSEGWETRELGGTIMELGEAILALNCQAYVLDPEEIEDQEEELAVNQHTLPQPIDDEEAQGDILLVPLRNNDGVPESLSLGDWKEYCENPKAPKFQEAIKRRMQDAQDDEDDDDDDDDEDEDEDDDDD
eukprot:CAMPEP_0196731750 /NCGR_PEP_ID=MMETSP1091-20130531/11339_1 /TAXON_ID=302021 /ORGANISM="Rhodomonas sp., Strain CCMP768" /LENGTH=151 /DNA_ID=CAMNT_0042074901 /DNA_START=231 /DNA_END=683 /DNA_ORIENTATION=-